ncbi:MAG: PqqD family peptide modification chaperone [Desulfobacterota bacterium]|nr:PqqD family peptide modification chaperone [Thermodesulfobacteriota bacterium]
MHPEQPLWMLVNEFGFECLKLFGEEKSLAQCISIIASRYGIDSKTAEQDILRFVDSLKKAGFIDDDKKIDIERKKIGFTSAFLHITDACNLKCKHCYATVYRHKRADISDNDFFRFLDRFFGAGGKRLILSGGEPLLHKRLRDFIELYSHATIRILTNGLLIDDNFASYIENKNVDIQVSLDGSTATIHDSIRGKDAFQGALGGIAVLKRHGLLYRTNICATITRKNIHDLPSLIRFVYSLGIRHIRFIPLRKRGDGARNWGTLHADITPEEYKEFYRYVFEEAQGNFPDMTIGSGLSGLVLRAHDLSQGNRGCSIGTNLVVDANGDIYPCVLLMDKQYKLGNIRTTSFEALRKHSVLNRLVDAIYERKNRITECNSCLWKNFCGGACLGEVHEKFGSIWRTDEYCDIRRELLEKAILRIIAGTIKETTRGKGPECF